MEKQHDLKNLTDRFEQQVEKAQEIAWTDIQKALSQITEQRDKGLHGLCCLYAAYSLLTTGKQAQCLPYLNEGIRCMLGTEQEREVSRCYNLLGVIAHGQNNLLLALEQYEMALLYCDKFDQQMMHSLVVSNMADAYYQIGYYERAIQNFTECVEGLEKAPDDTATGEYNYRNILASFGYCLLMMGNVEKAVRINEKLKNRLESRKEYQEPQLAAYAFHAYLYFSQDHLEEAWQETRNAIRLIQKKKQITVDADSLLNLVQFVIQAERYDFLNQILNIAEPQAAIEKNEGILLPLLMDRLLYCSDTLNPQEFQRSTEIFLDIKENYEARENDEILYTLKMSSKLHKIEEQQKELKEQNSRLHYQMNHDSLSGLYCKSYFNQYMNQAFEETLRQQISLGVLFLDIDYFKEINDYYGHRRGDECIVAVGDSIRHCMPEAFAARYGGDEFVVVTTNRSNEYVEKCAATLVAHIHGLAIANEHSQAEKVMTITVGVVNAVPHKSQKVWDFLSEADQLLYEQKREKKGSYRLKTQIGESSIWNQK